MKYNRIKSFKQFYPFYLQQHKKFGTRITHFIGTSFFFGLGILGIALLNAKILMLGVLLAYGFAWMGHFFIEKNRPATFEYPIWSLLGDIKMYFQILLGKENLNASS